MPPRVHRVTLGDPESDPEVDHGYISVNSRNQHNRPSGGRPQQSRGGVQTRGNAVEVTLGDVNPFGNPTRNTGHRGHHNDRDQGRHHHHSRRPPSDDDDRDNEDQDDDDQGHEEDGVISLPNINPFARGGGGGGGNGNSNRNPNANASTGRNSNTGRNTSQPVSRQRASQPPARQQFVPEPESEEDSEEQIASDEEEAPPASFQPTRAGAVPSNSRLLQQAPPAANSKAKAPGKPISFGAQESKQQPKTIIADEESDDDDVSDDDDDDVPPVTHRAGKTANTSAVPLFGTKPGSKHPANNDGTESDEDEQDDDDDGAEPDAIPIDPKGKGKENEGAPAKGKGKGAGPSAKKSGGKDNVNISASDSWSGEIGFPEGSEHHHHHHHHRHRPKRDYPAVDYMPDRDFFESSSSGSSTTSSSSSSSSTFDCDCPRGKHLHHCRFRREREREFDCDCPRGKHHRHCRHHHRYHSRHHHERDREHAWEREYMRGREYGFDCDCRGGFHHQHCPFWRRPPHHHGHHHHSRPKPWDQPPWWPYPFPPMITQADHKRNPFGEPLYANIPELPSLFDQVKDAYYTLPVPPTNLLRDLQEMHRRQVPYPPQPVPNAPPKPAETMLKFATALPAIAKEKDYLKAVPVILYQQLQSYYIDLVYNRLQSMVQVRFAERKGEKIVNRVHVVQRYRTAWNAVMEYRPKFDVDLVIPGDFVLRRWCISPDTSDENKPKTISKAMGLDPTLVMRGEIYQKNLDWVIKAVWEQLNGKADGFIFPGGNAEALQYIGSFKDDPPQPGAWRIKLQSVGDRNTVWINLFVKVAIRLNGQDLVVGVDQASAVSEDKYQMVKMYHTPNGPLGESPLGPIEQCALIMLGWWKRDTKQGDPPKDPGGMKIRASHFSLALTACRELDPTDELHISPGTGREQFSIQRSVAVALKLAKYLKMAYSSPVLVCASNNAKTTKPDQAQKPAMQFLFPLASCGILEAVYTQMIAVAQKPSLDELVAKFEELIGTLEGAKGGDDDKKDPAADKKNGGMVTNGKGSKEAGGDSTGDKPGQESTPGAGTGGSDETRSARTSRTTTPPAQGGSSTEAAPSPSPPAAPEAPLLTTPEPTTKADSPSTTPTPTPGADPEPKSHASSEEPAKPVVDGTTTGTNPAPGTSATHFNGEPTAGGS